MSSENKFASKSIATLFLNADLADVNFVFKIDEETEKVPAQKYILAASSPVFHAMFFGSIKEKDVVKIADSYPDAFKEFLQFCYLEEVTLTMENIKEVVRLTDKYDMADCLKNYAASIIEKLTIDNMCYGYQLAIIAEHDDLKSFCEKNICAFPDDVFKSTTFLHCDRNVLQHILELDGLLCKESEVFNACLEWAKFNCQEKGIDESKPEHLKAQLGDCFYQIRFGAMTVEEFVEHTAPYYEMFTQFDLANILYKTTAKFTPNKFNGDPRSNLQLEFSNDQALECKYSSGIGTSAYYTIQNPESLWFSTNIPVILGKLYCYSLRDSSGNAINVDFNLTIIEVNAQSFDVVAPTKILFNQTMKFTGTTSMQVVLPQPIVINPRKMYEIRLGTTSTTSYRYESREPKTEDKLDDKITVKFHRHPSSIERRGLVKFLYFSQF